MLRLISNEPTIATCQNCEHFHQGLNACAILKGINKDDPYITARCTYYLAIDKSQTLLELEEDNGQPPFFEVTGSKEITNSKYPSEPDIPSYRVDTIWYEDPSGLFGCWLINHSKRKLMNTEQIGSDKIKKYIYKSPYPLHNHNVDEKDASRMCWYVDEDGYGRYTML